MKLRYLSVFLLIALLLSAVELGLEYRALQKGFHAHFLSKIMGNSIATKRSKEFPYHSSPVELDKSPGYIRFWMSSASYALADGVHNSFPNIFCAELIREGQNCQMINAGVPGMTIDQNINQLKTEAVNWRPDYVVLYSMSLDIEVLSGQFFGAQDSSAKANEKDVVKSEGIKTVDQLIEAQLEQTTVYNHLRRYLGGTVLLSSILHDDLVTEADIAFKKTLEEFIIACNEIDAKPIFVGFASKYTLNNISEIDYEGSLWLLRYNKYLSPRGWVSTIARYNEIMKQTAIEHGLIYIDNVEKQIAGNVHNYTDFVHFTLDAHKLVGRSIADGFLEARNKRSQM